ncbi:MAG: ChbG/HpnK family deacetylase [Pirellulales bacterium]|nr:ChbG/HpnK family deacetylase [Pirellulales bacterium]
MTKHSILILHADDFGMNAGVTDGVLEGFRRGVLTSTSLLANAPDAARALTLWKPLLAEYTAGGLPSQLIRRELADPPQAFDLGVHLNLTLGTPLTDDYPAELLDSAGRFPGVYALFFRLRRSPEKYADALRQEIGRQIEFLRDHGFQPTHLNGHQYIELLPAVAALLPGILRRYEIGVVRVAEEPRLWRSTLFRSLSPANWLTAYVKKAYARRFRRQIARHPIAHPQVYFGTAHAGRVTLPLLRRFLAGPMPGHTVEIGLHPGYWRTEDAPKKKAPWYDPLADRRQREWEMITSPDLVRWLQNRAVRLGRLGSLAAPK